MTTAIVCDDEPRLAGALTDQLKALWPELNVVALGHSGGEALSLIAEHEPDFAFLDIKMPGLSGLDVARQLAGGDTAPRIVFVTAYDEHAIEAFDARAVDYLLKPVKTERLAETVARLKGAQTPPPVEPLIEALRQLQSAERKFLRWLNCGQGNEIDVIAVSEVLLLQSRDKYTAVITRNKERYIRTPLKDLIDQLDPEEFWQVHRGSVVRAAAIERVTRDDTGRMSVRLTGHVALIPVSGSFTGRFRQM
ncbi:MAG: response regulator transcription factor [Betaproteobacteria bacterium]|nr:response regulator transcription factor [Betaproteobacteria bacterium]